MYIRLHVSKHIQTTTYVLNPQILEVCLKALVTSSLLTLRCVFYNVFTPAPNAVESGIPGGSKDHTGT